MRSADVGSHSTKMSQQVWPCRVYGGVCYGLTCEAATGTPTHTLQGQTCSVISVVWSPDGRLLTTGSSDCTVRLWDAAKGTVTRVIQDARGKWVLSVAWSPCGRLVFAVADGRVVHVYRANLQGQCGVPASL
jgi:WD40 repeat protein